MVLKLDGPVEQQVWELVDKEGWETWKEENPEPSEGQLEAMLMRFFKKREDMTPEDFYTGVDPLQEVEGD